MTQNDGKFCDSSVKDPSALSHLAILTTASSCRAAPVGMTGKMVVSDWFLVFRDAICREKYSALSQQPETNNQ